MMRGIQPLLLEPQQAPFPQMPVLARRQTVVSLFAGAGGMDLGFRGGFDFLGQHYSRSPFDVIWANELVEPAARTYHKNLGHEIIVGDVWEHIGTLPARADVVIGGFPCQDISFNGKGQGIGEGTRSGLYRALVHAVEQLNPRIFVVENVKALKSAKHEESFKTITTDFESHGYVVNHHLYNSADYGVPQTRERVFIVGRLPDVGGFVPPEPLLTPDQWVTAGQAIGDLLDHPRDEIFSHTWSLAAVSGEQGNRHLKADRPGYTVRAEAHGNTHWHYSLPRRMTNREAARIQSFPDNYIFDAKLRDTERMIGNAVPPVLAWHIARAVAFSLGDQ